MENTSSGTDRAFKDPGTLPPGFVYRDQRGRYPWWVRSVDRITTPVDASTWERKKIDKIMMMLGPENEEAKATLEVARKRRVEMGNLSLGFLIGVAASWLYVQPSPVPWYAWGLFALGAAALAFGFDVLIGSYKEHQPRAAWMGLGMFGGLGVLMVLAAFGLAL